jgi:hypothetical protein
MSDSPFLLPEMPPRVTADQASTTARFWNGLADRLASLQDTGGNRRTIQESHWWMAYASVLAQTKEG